MGKIKERRERTANTEIENKAVLAEAPAKVKEFPYKKILVAVLAVVAVIACALLIINAVVDSKASKLSNNNVTVSDAVATVEVKGVIYEKTVEIMNAYPTFAQAYYNASTNYNKYAGNAKSSADVYNYVVTINDETYGEKSADVVASMLLSFNKSTGKVTYVLINKSSLVEIPTVGVGPLYDAYKFGGTPLYARSVQENYGIAINGYVDLPLASFVTAANELGGIEIDGTKYATDVEIYNYAKADDANVTNIVKALAVGAKDAGLMGLVGLLDTVASSISANISRSDFGAFVGMGAKVFGSEAAVSELGYDGAKGFYSSVVKDNYAEIYGGVVSYFDYATQITAIQKLIYGE